MVTGVAWQDLIGYIGHLYSLTLTFSYFIHGPPHLYILLGHQPKSSLSLIALSLIVPISVESPYVLFFIFLFYTEIVLNLYII